MTPMPKVGDSVVIVDKEKKAHPSSTVTVLGTEAIQAKTPDGKVFDALKHRSTAAPGAPFWRLATEDANPDEKP